MEISEEAVLVAREGTLDLEYVLIIQHLIEAYYLSQTMISFASKVLSSFPFPRPPVLITTLNKYPLFNLFRLTSGYTPNEAASPPSFLLLSVFLHLAEGQLTDSDQLYVSQFTRVPAYFVINSHHHTNPRSWTSVISSTDPRWIMDRWKDHGWIKDEWNDHRWMDNP